MLNFEALSSITSSNLAIILFCIQIIQFEHIDLVINLFHERLELVLDFLDVLI